MLQIGPYSLPGRVILAPMAGVSDRPFRDLCLHQGAALAVSEMLTSDSRLWHTRKSQLRLAHIREDEHPCAVQIAGAVPEMLAEAARRSQEQGANIIDINMGCPAKKVCNKAAGSALLRDEALVERILRAVVAAVSVPVTLKIRLGWSPEEQNAVRIAGIAESCGIQALAVHGRTRACRFGGRVNYEAIAQVKQAVKIPVIANGDITDAVQARQVLEYTGADALMVGRGAQGNPWIFREINHYLRFGQRLAPPGPEEQHQVIHHHVAALHRHYGEHQGIRIARKHVGWYLARQPESLGFRRQFNQLEEGKAQLDQIDQYFSHRAENRPVPVSALTAHQGQTQGMMHLHHIDQIQQKGNAA